MISKMDLLYCTYIECIFLGQNVRVGGERGGSRGNSKRNRGRSRFIFVVFPKTSFKLPPFLFSPKTKSGKLSSYFKFRLQNNVQLLIMALPENMKEEETRRYLGPRGTIYAGKSRFHKFQMTRQKNSCK